MATQQARQASQTRDERRARGKLARKMVPRSSHAGWEPAADRRDPVDVLTAQAETRVPDLVPIRYGRMLVSPFTFYRGAAAIMAEDLAGTPTTGIVTQLCGDAHLSNFGGFGTPERDLVFGLNDFDETLPGPWEWDIKRLAASMVIAARDRGLSAKQSRQVATATAGEYRRSMREYAKLSNLELWYRRIGASDMRDRFREEVGERGERALDSAVSKAMTKDRMRALSKLTCRVDGELRFQSNPPLLVPIEELVPDAMEHEITTFVQGVLRSYRRTLQEDRRRLVDTYRYVHLARKVVGVGSVGTRAWVVLMIGVDETDPLVLQVKEAQPSVLEPVLKKSEFANSGQRVVSGQRMMQTASDIFLGWHRTVGVDGVERDFYVRQLWDWKASANVESFDTPGLTAYGRLCASTLARAHGRSGDRIAIASYLGSGDDFDRAIAEFSVAYADQNEADFARLKDAVTAGRIAVETGV
jgi:uncharacterized protein (DUF2252 family)